MNKPFLTISLVCIFAAALIFLAMKINSSGEAAAETSARLHETIVTLQRNIDSLGRVLDSIRTQTPGLGEYMSTIQLHTAKLWYAAEADNWDLAAYETGEIAETMEAVELLHAKRNNVDISSVLNGVRLSQLPLLRRSIAGKDRRAFSAAYRQTLDACNGCHRSAGYPFIHLVPPNGLPVTNQDFHATGNK
jgi:hypothetical protein